MVLDLGILSCGGKVIFRSSLSGLRLEPGDDKVVNGAVHGSRWEMIGFR